MPVTLSHIRAAERRSAGGVTVSPCPEVIENGLVHDGRLIRFTVTISNRPGGLAALSRLIAAAGASIKDFVHERAFSGPDLSAVPSMCTVETRNRAHVALHRTLRRHGFPLVHPR